MGHVMLYYHSPSKVGRNIIIILYSTRTLRRRRGILVIWLGNSCSPSRSSSHASLRFPVGFSKIAFTPRVFAVGLKRAAINKNNVYNTRSLRPRSDYILRFPLRCYNFAPSSHPPRLIAYPCVIGRGLFSPRFCTEFRMVFWALTYDIHGRPTRTLAIV